MPNRFVVVGESLVDVVTTEDGERTEYVGGSPLNVATGLARLGVPTLLVTQVGDDPRGRRVLQQVHASGAEVAAYTQARTNLATARLDADRAARYEFELTWTLPTTTLPPATGLHVGSLGAALSPGRAAVLDLVAQAAARKLCVTFDPNLRPAFVADPARAWHDLVETARGCTLVKVSDEDLALARPGTALSDAADELLCGERTELVVVTRGDRGAQAFRTRDSVDAPAPPVNVVDTVGAGDAFMAATVGALLERHLLTPGALTTSAPETLRQVLRAGMQAAALACARHGAYMPTRGELPPQWPHPAASS